VLLNEDSFSEDGRHFYDKGLEKGIPAVKEGHYGDYNTILDAIFGTGFKGEVREPAKSAIENINSSGAYVVCADINSGLNGDTGLGDLYVISDLTVSIGTYKYGHFLGNADKAMKRKLIRVCEDIASTCYADKTDLPEVLEKTEKNVFDLSQSTRSSDFVPIRDVVANTMAMIEKASKTKGGITGIPTGFVDLDNKLMGLHPSDLVLIAARPSMGKTALVLNMAENMAFRQNRAIAIFSLEMPKEILAQRLLSMNSRVDSQNIRSGQLAKSEWHDIIESAGNLASSKLIIDDNTSNISVAEIRSRARRYKLEYNIEAIMIDYLQLMSGSGSGRNDSRQQEISEISRGLKGIARELNIPVIALSQLSRAVEQRSDHRPMLSDLRESGAIEQDADVVMFIYREDYYNEDTDRKGISEIIIAKQRNGPIGTVDLAWIPSLTKFANLDHSAKREE